jgi:hypothetical protein
MKQIRNTISKVLSSTGGPYVFLVTMPLKVATQLFDPMPR